MLRMLLAALVCVFSQYANAQQRVASINMCADQLLLLLAPAENILSISYLSADPQYSVWTQTARKFPHNHAKAEELVSLQPDLVLAGQYSDPMVIRLLQQQGIAVYQMTRPQQLSQLFDEALAVGELLGVQQRAKQLVEEWQNDIQHLLTLAKTGVQPRMAIIGPNGFTEGSGSLRDQMLQKAGIINVASEMGMVGNSEFTLEQIVAQQPDLIAIEDATVNNHSLAQRLLDHPAIHHLSAKEVRLPANLWSCPGPSYVAALRALIQAKLWWQRTED